MLTNSKAVEEWGDNFCQHSLQIEMRQVLVNSKLAIQLKTSAACVNNKIFVCRSSQLDCKELSAIVLPNICLNSISNKTPRGRQ